jgi:DNA replication and repair protein RecF
MKLLSLTLRQFRNHVSSAFSFGAASNVLLGKNGQGKTNVLEAISYLCLTKSFYAGADATAVHCGTSMFEVEGEFLSGVDVRHRVRIVYDEQLRQKKFFINASEITRLSEVIGLFPIVVLSPENNSITFGSPSERRKFADLVMSQSSKAFVEDMMEYKRVLRQRNKILSDAQGNDCSVILAPWTEMLIRHGSAVIHKRNNFLTEFVPYVEKAYEAVSHNGERPALRYVPQIEVTGSMERDAVADALRLLSERKAADERRSGSTLFGPQRDDIAFSIDGLPLREYASQGQHKTFLIALKIAEFWYLKERCAELPIILFDDVFSELDETRSRQLLEMLAAMGQTFITTTSERVFEGVRQWDDAHRKFYIRSGAVVDEEAAA